MGTYTDSVYELAKEMLLDEGERDIADFLSETENDNIDDLEPQLDLKETFPCSVLVGGIPVVTKAKYDKLKELITKQLKKASGDGNDITIDMPVDPTDPEGKTYGCLIATFESEKIAQTVVDTVDGLKLDQKHSYKVLSLNKFDEIRNRPDVFRGQHDLERLPRWNFRTWLGDAKCREQLLLRYQTNTEVYWHDPIVGQPVLYYGGENQKAAGKIWCDWSVGWSPQGSYIYTFHKHGLKVWAGPDFSTALRLPHEHVQEIDWSPNEEFVLLWNGSHAHSDPETAVRIYHVLTGRCVRECRTPKMSPKPGTEFPHFLWSSDGKYIAEMSDFNIRVRDTETWELVPDSEGKPAPFKFNNLQTFQWSPKGNILAAYTLEKDNNPARLTLWSIEKDSRKEVASRSRTQCEAVMHWQSEGDYLCLLVTKLTKTGKRITTNVEILRVREKQTPVDVVTIEDVVQGFFWETKGRRFAVLAADDQGHKAKLLIYALGQEKCERIVCFDLPSSSFNEVVWAPEGQYFIVASKSVTGGASSSGDLLFAGLTTDNKLEIFHKNDHYMLTDIQWDPSSRYVLTAVTQPVSNDQQGYKYSMEAGYSIWTFQGRNLIRQPKEKLYHVAWRPHPPPMADAKTRKEVRGNLQKTSKEYDAQDNKAKEAAREKFRKERDEKIKGFKEILERLDAFKVEKDNVNGWADAMAQFYDEAGWTQDEDRQEEVLEVTQEFIPENV